MSIQKVTIDIMAGSTLQEAAKEVQGMANNYNAKVVFEFNSIKMAVYPGASIKKIIEMYDEAFSYIGRIHQVKPDRI